MSENRAALEVAEADNPNATEDGLATHHASARKTSQLREREWDKAGATVRQLCQAELDIGGTYLGESSQPVAGLVQTMSHPGWTTPDPLRMCRCNADPYPHIHCESCNHPMPPAAFPASELLNQDDEVLFYVYACAPACADNEVAERIRSLGV